MNILMINGTMRKSTTYTIGKMVIDKVKKEEDRVTEIFLPKDMPEFCRGCGICIKEDEKKCPDYLMYLKRITEMINHADLLVFTTPVFVYHVTGQLKTLLDHYGYRWMVHRPEASMFHKQAICISTAASGGMKHAIKDIKDSLSFWGISEVHTLGVAVRATSWDGVSDEIKEKIKLKTDTIATAIKRDPKEVHTSLKIKLMFYIMRIMQKKLKLSPDVEYWEEKGWLGKTRPWNV